MDTLRTQIQALVPVTDGSSAVYRFVDDLVEERGNGQHRELAWNMPTTSGPFDTGETRELTSISFSLFLHRMPPGIAERTQYAWIQAVNSERAHIHRTINGINSWGDANVLEVIYRGCEAEDGSISDPAVAGGVHRSLVARLTFTIDVLSQEND